MFSFLFLCLYFIIKNQDFLEQSRGILPLLCLIGKLNEENMKKTFILLLSMASLGILGGINLLLR